MRQDGLAHVKNCRHCQDVLPANPKEPPKGLPAPWRPFLELHLDAAEVAGHQFLVIVDRFSGWVTIRRLRNRRGAELAFVLEQFLLDRPKPELVHSDNGTNFTSPEFERLCNGWDIVHSTSSPTFAQGNSWAENGVKSVKKIVTALVKDGRLNWDAVFDALVTRNNTPPAAGQPSPAELTFGVKLKDKASLLWGHSQMTQKCAFTDRWQDRYKLLDEHFQTVSKRREKDLGKLGPGDLVAVKSDKGWIDYGRILAHNVARRNYKVLMSDDSVKIRNRSNLRSREPKSVPDDQKDVSPRSFEPVMTRSRTLACNMVTFDDLLDERGAIMARLEARVAEKVANSKPVQVEKPEPENVGHVGGLSYSPAGSDVSDPFDPPAQPVQNKKAAQAAPAAQTAAHHGAAPKLSAAASAALSKRSAQKRKHEAPKYAVSATGERLELVPDQRGLGARLYRVVEPVAKPPKKKKAKRQPPVIDLTSPSPSPPSATPTSPDEKLDWVKELEEAAAASSASEDDPGFESEGYVASVTMTPEAMRATIRTMERGLAYYASRMAKNFESAFPGATIKLPAGTTSALTDSTDSEGEGEKKKEKKKKKKKKAASDKMDVDQPPT